MKKLTVFLILILLLVPTICLANPISVSRPVVNVNIPSVNGNGVMPVMIEGEVDYWGIRIGYNDCVNAVDVRYDRLFLTKYGDDYVEFIGFGEGIAYVTLEGNGASTLDLYFTGYKNGRIVFSICNGGVYCTGGDSFMERWHLQVVNLKRVFSRIVVSALR